MVIVAGQIALAAFKFATSRNDSSKPSPEPQDTVLARKTAERTVRMGDSVVRMESDLDRLQRDAADASVKLQQALTTLVLTNEQILRSQGHSEEEIGAIRTEISKIPDAINQIPDAVAKAIAS